MKTHSAYASSVVIIISLNIKRTGSPSVACYIGVIEGISFWNYGRLPTIFYCFMSKFATLMTPYVCQRILIIACNRDLAFSTVVQS